MTNNCKLLLVDDDKLALFVLSERFKFYGVSVDMTLSDVEALSWLDKKHYDLAIIDIDSYYALNALNIVKKIKFQNQTSFSHHPTILIGLATAFNEDEEEEKYAHVCFKQGMDDLYPKDLTPEMIKKILTFSK